MTLSFYHCIPKYEDSLDVLKNIANKRNELYRILVKGRQDFYLYSANWKEHTTKDIGDNVSLFEALFNKNFDNARKKEVIKIDDIGHWLLFFVYLSNDESHLFLECELDWLYLRAAKSPSSVLRKFISDNNLPATIISDDERKQYEESLISTYNIPDYFVKLRQFYKVKADTVATIMPRQNVFIVDGDAIIPNNYLAHFIVGVARDIFERQIASGQEACQMYNDDEKIQYLIGAIPTISSKEIVDSDKRLSISNIEQHAVSYFPLCMQLLHRDLKENSHLKHDGRLQYTNFLKSCGMRFEEGLEFWKIEFTKAISEQEFVSKKYKYYFEHAFGKVGSKINYYPFFCSQLIKNAPNVGTNHGCPFEHLSNERLIDVLKERHLKNDEIINIVEKRKESAIGACKLFFEAKHNGRKIDYFETPSEYYAKCKDIEDLFLDSDDD